MNGWSVARCIRVVSMRSTIALPLLAGPNFLPTPENTTCNPCYGGRDRRSCVDVGRVYLTAAARKRLEEGSLKGGNP
jgi:hypothetical protein